MFRNKCDWSRMSLQDCQSFPGIWGGLVSTGEKVMAGAFCRRRQNCSGFSVGVGGIGQTFCLIGQNSSRSKWEWN